MKRIHLLIIIATALFTAACTEEYDLQKTVFIEDKIYPGLPIYSEWGYNSFGAYVDRTPFVSTNTEVPAKAIVRLDTFKLQLVGMINWEVVKLTFALPGYKPADYQNLTDLNNKTYDLKTTDWVVFLFKNNKEYRLNVLQGSLQFTKVQNMYVDNELTRCILSGYFNVKALIDNEPTAIANGRFDLGIGFDNFYNY